MALFDVRIGPEPGEVRPRGEIDMATAPQLHQALEEASRTGARLIVDMADVTFIDSAGLHALVSAALAQRDSQAVMLTNVPDAVERILKVVGMDQLDCLEIRTGV